MIEIIQNLHPVAKALLATYFTWALTALGTAPVFLAMDMSWKVLNAMLGFASGVMVLHVALG